MLCLDTSLKAIHNKLGSDKIQIYNVYAMLRYKFESNSQLERVRLVVGVQCVCYA